MAPDPTDPTGDTRGTGTTGDTGDSGATGDAGDAGATGHAGEDRERPPLRLVRGDATPEEVAALLAVLSAASAGGPEPAPRHISQWSSPERAVRRPLAPGSGAWRASAWPR